MSLTLKRNLWIILGICLMTFINITIFVPYVNYLFAILCFKRAYDIHKDIKHSDIISNNIEKKYKN